MHNQAPLPASSGAPACPDPATDPVVTPARAHDLQIPIPATEFAIHGPAWLDCRRIGGLDLRYWLLKQLHRKPHTTHTIKTLTKKLHQNGFTVRGRVSKTLSDALATETRKGRITRTGWGRYQAGQPIPKTTWWRIRNRTSKLHRHIDAHRIQIGERYFHTWRTHSPLAHNRTTHLTQTTAGPKPRIHITIHPQTPNPTIFGSTKVANQRNPQPQQPPPPTHPTPTTPIWPTTWQHPPHNNPKPQTAKPQTAKPQTATPQTERAQPPNNLKIYKLADLTPKPDPTTPIEPDPGWF